MVLSRAVLRDPPPDDEVPALPEYDAGLATTAAIIGLIAVMAVLEVVLLAGPAFAVGPAVNAAPSRCWPRPVARLGTSGGWCSRRGCWSERWPASAEPPWGLPWPRSPARR